MVKFYQNLISISFDKEYFIFKINYHALSGYLRMLVKINLIINLSYFLLNHIL